MNFNESEQNNKKVEEEVSFVLAVDKTPDRQALLSSLVRWGYEQTDHTETPKTFSTRGGILDIFLPYSANPSRIEFFGNTVDSIRLFNPRSQRTIKNIDRIEILPPPTNNVSATEKISLMKYLNNDFNIITVYEESGLFSVHFGDSDKSELNLNCKNLAVSDESVLPNSILLDSALKETTSNNLFLFSTFSFNFIFQLFVESKNQRYLHYPNTTCGI